tara:strand:- start:30 stop:278 length:249 start_codon:yes stop_codon:yes gene_type:complete
MVLVVQEELVVLVRYLIVQHTLVVAVVEETHLQVLEALVVVELEQVETVMELLVQLTLVAEVEELEQKMVLLLLMVAMVVQE